MPSWIENGFQDYQSRFPRHISLSLNEIATPERNTGSDINKLKAQEGERLLKAAVGDHIVALDEKGKGWSSRQFSERLQEWLEDRQDVSFLIGGPDGHSPEVFEQANDRLSLSVMTMPHMLVRVVLAEQLYRAYSITQNHPYHRD